MFVGLRWALLDQKIIKGTNVWPAFAGGHWAQSGWGYERFRLLTPPLSSFREEREIIRAARYPGGFRQIESERFPPKKNSD